MAALFINEMNEESELVLNSDGSVYHLHLKAEHIADTVLLVGDPGRVQLISSKFERIDCKISNREFVTHTGWFQGKRITALSTGIGTDNIDIVVNELDAAVNMSPISRTPNSELKQLNLIRLGTCGALQSETNVESTVISEYAIGLDGVKHFYRIESLRPEQQLEKAFVDFMNFPAAFNTPYAVGCDSDLLQRMNHLGERGITITANGFFGPQGRKLRIPLVFENQNETLSKFEFGGLNILNYEMESAALYALGRALGHRCICLCVVVANRKAGKFSTDYQPAINQLIENTLTSI